MTEEKLSEIIRLHAKWLSDEPGGIRANLSGANLSCAYLSHANLRYANLSRADLSCAYLSHANLSCANLSCADLSGANLSHANLSHANLSRANLSGANLSGANLSDADLSGASGLIDAIDYIETHFERVKDGYIVYKTFGGGYAKPDSWAIEPGAIIEEVCNPNRTNACGCGINVAPIEWVKENYKGDVYKLLIRFEWLPGVVVPYNTDGKIRCSRAQIIGKVA
ncbi:MAG: pentapeptide repeat-containing protein [Candidatus Pararuminococcus gallinarum]